MPPASRTAPPAPPRVPRPPAGTTPAPPLDTPRANPGEAATLTATIGPAVWTLHSSKAAHRVTRQDKDGTRQVIEYPADAWAAAARFLVGAAERELRAAGSVTRGEAFCGDCGATVHKGACPTHGDLG